MDKRELSLLSKRARDKEYRLRKKGAMPEEVAKNSPRKPWAEVKNMTSRQKIAYAKKLQKFNSRENRLTPLASGEIVPYKVIKETNNYIKHWNKKAEKELKRILKLNPAIKQHLQQKRFIYGDKVKGSVLGSLTEIKMTEPPKTKRWANKRHEKLKKMVSKTFDSRRKDQRKNMSYMLDVMGAPELANIIRNMKNDRFDVMVTGSDIWTLLGLWYIPNEDRLDKNPIIIDMSSQVREVIYKAQLFGLSDKERENRMKNYKKKEVKSQNKAALTKIKY